ncbi:hypothetical protein [Paenibacillus planticolens]|uniref:Uncharacterized protein n=1 Tax=Paenibacillus planticolens TaxID=2654976 RepID=A0ABX1ZTK9_9BACL|nr:hypothetical protein [Paenibacillus planticolens]NOV03231.1 hypothetical protein [Paenibacillus planticolens]
MAQVKAARQPDFILITWRRVRPGAARRITASRVIGNASPCTFTLAPGRLLINAFNCLLDADIGFKVVFQKNTSSLTGVVLLQRNH